jgi:hypothetical protein
MSNEDDNYYANLIRNFEASQQETEWETVCNKKSRKKNELIVEKTVNIPEPKIKVEKTVIISEPKIKVEKTVNISEPKIKVEKTAIIPEPNTKVVENDSIKKNKRRRKKKINNIF